MPREYIFDLTLTVKDPNVPFKILRSTGVQSGDLIQVFSRFQLQLVQLLKELHEVELLEVRMQNDEEIPF